MFANERINAAAKFAAEAHAGQFRKGPSAAPYFSHLKGVAKLVEAAGGNDDQVIGGLLHDAVENCIGERPNIEAEIAEAFGANVLKIVLACSDAWEAPKPPWKERKVNHINKLSALDAKHPALLVYLADKVNNLESLLSDAPQLGGVFALFNGGEAGTKWYFESLLVIFAEKLGEIPLVGRYRAAVHALSFL